MCKYFILLLLYCFSLVWASDPAELEKSSIERLARTFQAWEKEGGERIWPHFHLPDRPAVFHFKNGHVYAFGLTRPSSLWERCLIQHYPVLFCARYPVALVALHPSFLFERERAFVFGLDHDDTFSFFPLWTFIHERFHLHQLRFFLKEKVSEAVVGDYESVEYLSLMELEHRLLTHFLQASEPQEKVQDLKNYLAVSQIRRKHLDPASVKWEDHQQKMEGLADYVSVKTYHIFPSIPHFKAETVFLEMRAKKTVGLSSLVQDAMKGRHYFVGAILGWALDFCGIPNWKWRIERENISLQALLEKAFFMEEREKLERVADVQQVWDWTGIQAQIRQQLEKEKNEIAEVLQFFTQQEGLIIQMGMPSGHMSGGGRHQKSYQIDDAKALLEDTSLSTSQDQSWTLRFKAMPILFEKQNGNRVFKLSTQTILKVDGKEVSLKTLLQQKPVEKVFSSLVLQDNHCELSCIRSGKIVVQDKDISFIFD